MPKRPTSYDVAKAAGVSRTTVSLVLNNIPEVRISEATREKVIQAVKMLDYHPNIAGKRLASGKTFTIGLLIRQNQEQVFADAYFLKTIIGVQNAAEKQGLRVLLKIIEPETATGYEALIKENQVDGIILSGPRDDDTEIIQMHQQGFPIMLIGQLTGYGIPFIDVDAVMGARNATKYLIDQGHRRIAMITNAHLEYTSARQRLEGYTKALGDAGMKPHPSLIKQGNFTPNSGCSAMLELLKIQPRVTAVFVASDVVAMGVMQAIKQAGLAIPGDISVVGFDDLPMAEFFDPPLTTVHLPAYGLGWSAGERLGRLVSGDTLDQAGIFLETELIIRQSVASSGA